VEINKDYRINDTGYNNFEKLHDKYINKNAQSNDIKDNHKRDKQIINNSGLNHEETIISKDKMFTNKDDEIKYL